MIRAILTLFRPRAPYVPRSRSGYDMRTGEPYTIVGRVQRNAKGQCKTVRIR